MWTKITEDNFSELNIGNIVATANPDERLDEDKSLPVEDRGLRLAEMYTISGVVETEKPLIQLERLELSDTELQDHGVTRAELINFWWWKKPITH
ncbi:MAG: hypothetical protein QM802_21005 [Agriterribacter sp.]